jgi:anion-transporting  ArsA/GET3 family ATPase
MQLQSAVRATEPATADSVLETLRKLQPEQRRIDQAHDRFLYNKVRNQPTLQACQEYLEKAPLKTMEKAVQAYADYLKALENPLDVTVEIKIFWHENYHPDGWPDRGENYIQVYIDDTQVFQSKEPIAENPDNLSGEVGTFQISKKRRHDRVTIKVKIVEDDSLMSGFDDDGGVGQQECSLEELKKGIRIPLRPQDGSNFENRADLVITAGWPSEPELPLWRE